MIGHSAAHCAEIIRMAHLPKPCDHHLIIGRVTEHFPRFGIGPEGFGIVVQLPAVKTTQLGGHFEILTRNFELSSAIDLDRNIKKGTDDLVWSIIAVNKDGFDVDFQPANILAG